MEDGQRIRVKGRGAAGAGGGPSGDLYVVVHVRPHRIFARRGTDLTVRVPVTFAEATLGAEVKVPTLEEPVTVRIPPGTPSGKVLRVRGRGVDAGRARRGDLLVTIDVKVPVQLNDEQRSAVEVARGDVHRRPARRRSSTSVTKETAAEDEERRQWNLTREPST